MKPLLTSVALATSLLALPVSAKEKPPVFVEAKPVKDSKTAVTINPAKAYIYVRTSNAMPLHFTRIASIEDQAAYEKLKAAAFVEAREDYEKALKKYERDLALSKQSSGVKKPKKPIEPTEANFQFLSFGQLANFTVGTFNRFQSKGGSSYLHEVTPGTYRIYGQVDPLLGFGVCYCMGSVTFEAKAGQVTDLGTVGPDPANSEPPEKGDSSSPRFVANAFAWTPVDGETATDPRLSALTRVPADFRAAGKTANYMGIAISRIPAIAGVIGYERDRIMDMKMPQYAATEESTP
jgi:hypothetical protein